MDELRITPPPPRPAKIFGSAQATFSPTQRLGSDASRLSQIQDGKWKAVSEYMGSGKK